MTRFLRDMVAIPSESCDEKRVVHRIKEEMEKVGFIKSKSTRWATFSVISATARVWWQWTLNIDTVGIGNIKNWGNPICTKAWKLMN